MLHGTRQHHRLRVIGGLNALVERVSDGEREGFVIAYDGVARGLGVYVKRIVVGAKSRGLGREALARLLAHARGDLGATFAWLNVAADNARRLGLAVQLSQGDWLDGCLGPYDLVVSNPPYVREDDEHLAALAHEPMQALAAGADGLLIEVHDRPEEALSDGPQSLTLEGFAETMEGVGLVANALDRPLATL